MKVITIQQPWAHLIIHGLPDTTPIIPKMKNVENRTWSSTYRGSILIHSGKGKTYREAAEAYGLKPKDMTFGAVIGVVEMYDCKRVDEMVPTHWTDGPWCHLYRNPRPLRNPIPWKGALGLWTPPQDLLDAIVAQGFLRTNE